MQERVDTPEEFAAIVEERVNASLSPESLVRFKAYVQFGRAGLTRTRIRYKLSTGRQGERAVIDGSGLPY